MTWDETSSWKNADEIKFQNFDNLRSEWLTWIYILDKQFYNLLWSKFGTMRGIAARGDTGNFDGDRTDNDFNSSTSDLSLINIVKAKYGKWPECNRANSESFGR